MKKFIVRENDLTDGSCTYDVCLVEEDGNMIEVVNAHNEYHAALCCEDFNLIASKYSL